MHILRDRASINAAIATMHPAAREAAQLLALRLCENPAILQDEDVMRQEWLQAGAVSFARTGANSVDDDDRFADFMENHGTAFLNVGVSIALFVAADAERKRKWGWLGKAAAVAAGVAVGAFFG